jgi:ferritin
MISQKMRDALNKQVNAELYSAYMYLSMSAYFSSANLPGFASWMKIQAQEETGHAMKIYDFIIERAGRATLKAIEAPPAQWKSPLDAFEATFKHEQKVTGLINNLVDLAIEEKDHATKGFLQWFVDEQVEEEASADAIVQQLKLIKEAPGALFMINNQLGQRTAGGGENEKE